MHHFSIVVTCVPLNVEIAMLRHAIACACSNKHIRPGSASLAWLYLGDTDTAFLAIYVDVTLSACIT